MAEEKDDEAAYLAELEEDEQRHGAEEPEAPEAAQPVHQPHKWVLRDVFTRQELSKLGKRTDAAICEVLARTPFFEELELPERELCETKDDGEVFDASAVEPLNAFDFQSADLKEMLEQRDVKPKGFYNDDARTLQKLMDGEHSATVAKARAAFEAKQREAGEQAFRHAHKLKVLQALKQEARVCVDQGDDGDLVRWLITLGDLEEAAPEVLAIADVIRASSDPPAAGRCVAKVLYSRVASIVSLDLGRAHLDDGACAYIVRACRAPGSRLASIELEGNGAGPLACGELARTVIACPRLTSLSLEGNELAKGDPSGFLEFCAGLRDAALTRLSLWRCNLPAATGAALAAGIGPALMLLEAGGNAFFEKDLYAVEDALRANRDARDKHAEDARLLRRKTRKEFKAKASADKIAAKEKEVAEFLERRRLERKDRRAQEAVEKAEADALAKAEMEAREKERLALAAKPKGKGKKGKGKKGKKKK